MNLKYLGAVLGVVAIVVLGVIFLGHKSPSVTSEKVQVAASFYPLYFFASQIGGDKADVMNVTPAGSEPHDYEPTAQDMARIEASRLLIVNGASFEAWGEKIGQNIDPQKTLIVAAGEALATQTVVEDGETVTDPHVWLSPVLGKQMVDKIEAGFTQVDPANAGYYAANAAALQSKLDELDAAYRQGLASCAKKDIITSHSAFGYLATTYRLNQISITGISPDSEPSLKHLADVILFAKKNNVTVIFFESIVSPKLSQTIANEIGAKTMVLDPIEGLADDDIVAGKNYFTEMRQNLTNLEAALECSKT